MSLQPFCSLLPSELEKLLADSNEPRYRTSQLLNWVYRKGTLNYDLMTNVGKKAAEQLEKLFSLSVLEKVKVQDSEDGETTKFLWKLEDGKTVESVLIHSDQRRTVCLSSQVGCGARCAFCASGQLGLIRNLTTAEIVEQMVQIQGVLHSRGERITHLVFMGMGEPLENPDALMQALAILIDPLLGAFSPRRITVSTVGIIEGIERLAEEGRNVNLALSLHAPSQQIREKIVPYARKTPLSALLKAVRRYAKKTKRNITYEYVLLAGINDRLEDAKELSRLLKGDQCCVNLIPYNPVPGRQLQRPKREVIEAFRAILDRANVRCTWRYTKGKDIAAACGQLAVQMPSAN